MNSDISIVTAFFDIGRGNWQGRIGSHSIHGWLQRSSELYLAWFDNLGRLKNQVIVFTDSKFASKILESRRRHGLELLTTIITCDDLFSENEGDVALALRSFKNAMSSELHDFVQNPDLPEYWNAEYVLLNALKSVFVCTAIRMGLTANRQIAWIDFGYCRDEKRFDSEIPWRFDCGGWMNIFYIRKPDHRPIFDIARSGDVYFQGCHLVGPANTWVRLRELMDEAFASLLACGLVDDDQTALLMAYRRMPELFRIHEVDPLDWFVVLRDFRQSEEEARSRG